MPAEVARGARLRRGERPGLRRRAAAARGARVDGARFFPRDGGSSHALAESGIEFREGTRGAARSKPASRGGVMNFDRRAVARGLPRSEARARLSLRSGRNRRRRGFRHHPRCDPQARNPNVPLPPGPPFFRFSDAGECDNVLKIAGFRNVDVRRSRRSGALARPSCCSRRSHRFGPHAGPAARAVRSALAAIRDAVAGSPANTGITGPWRIPMPPYSPAR